MASLQRWASDPARSRKLTGSCQGPGFSRAVKYLKAKGFSLCKTRSPDHGDHADSPSLALAHTAHRTHAVLE
jgi:hypothetical protein